MKYLVLAILVWNISSVLAQDSPESFEGVITYSVEVEYPENYKYGWYMDQKYGDTMLLFISSNGDYLRTYINTGDMGWDFTSYSHSENTVYAKWKNIDTVFWYPATDTSIQLKTMNIGEDALIMNQKCKSIFIESYFPLDSSNLSMSLYYSGYPKANPELYKNHKDSFYDLVYPMSKSHFLMMISDMGDFTITYKAIAIEEVYWPSKLFKLPKDVPLKRWF